MSVWSLISFVFFLGAVVGGCGAQSESSMLEAVQASIAKRDYPSAIVQSKSLIEKNPQSAIGRHLLGFALLETGDAVAAQVELQKAHELKPDDEAVVVALADALLLTGQAKKLIDTLGNTTLSDPKNSAELMARMARAYAVMGQIDQVDRLLKQALQLEPKNVSARMGQARLIASRGDTARASEMVRSVLTDSPKDLQALLFLGELLSGFKPQRAAAVDAFRQALLIDARQPRAHSGLIRIALSNNDIAAVKAQISALQQAMPASFEALFYSAQLSLVEGDLKKARQESVELLKMASRSVPVLELAGVIELRRGDLLSAERLLTQALQQAPERAAARRFLAELQLRAGRPTKAYSLLKPLLDLPNPGPEELGLAGEAAMLEGDLTRASDYYARAASINPDDSKANVGLALTLVAKGNSVEGLAKLESIAAAHKSTFADLALVNTLARGGDVPGALKAIERLQSKTPTSAIAPFMRGRLLLLSKDQQGARKSFEAALSADPVYFPAVAELAALDVASGKFDDARKRFEAVLARDAKDYRALVALAELRQRTSGKPEEIESLLKEAIKASPDESAPRLALVKQFLLRRSFNAALATAQDAVAVLPTNVQVLDALGRAQLASGDTQQASITFLKIASLQPASPEPYERLAELNLMKGDHAAAVQNLRKALELAPASISAQRELIRIATQRQRFGDALAVARSIQKQRPKDAAGFIIESQILVAQRSWDAAIAAMQTALTRQRSTDIATRMHVLYVLANRATDAERFATSWQRDYPSDAKFLFHLGWMAVESKDLAGAESYFRRVIALRPDDAATLNNLASVMVQRGESGALPLAERANQLAPGQAPFMETLASAFAADKQLKQAIEWQRNAADTESNVPAYRLGLAKMFIEIGDRAQARAELEKLTKLGAGYSGQAEVAELLKGL